MIFLNVLYIVLTLVEYDRFYWVNIIVSTFMN